MDFLSPSPSLFMSVETWPWYLQIGPPRPLPGNETPAILRQRLKTQLADQFPTEAPFTIQRLAELLLEPQKHYSRLDKLV